MNNELFQDSKRSSDFFVGRNDYNIKTIFAKDPLKFLRNGKPVDDDCRIPQPGDYVVVQVC